MYYEKRRKRWRVVFERDGRRATKSFETERAAKAFEAELTLGVADTTPEQTARLTFEGLCVRWLREHCKAERSETQWAKDESRIKLHLLPSLGQVPVTKLQKGHLMALKSELQEKKAKGKKHLLSKRTANHVMVLAKGIMNWAVDQGIVGSNPFRTVKKLRIAEQDYDWWTVEELDQYLERGKELGFDPELLLLVETAMMSGMRRGELAGLLGKRLEFGRKRIKVVESFSFEIGRLVPTKGKTIDEIPMNSRLLAALEPKRFLKPDEPVFRRSLFPDLTHRFQASCEAAGVRVIRFHDLRHSFASNLAVAGTAATTIQKLMRHSSLQMTERYMHLHPDHLAGSTEVLCTQAARTENPKSKNWSAQRDLNPQPRVYETLGA